MLINGVIVKQPDVFTDYRGDYWTTWKKEEWDMEFNHDKVSTSGYGVLRGIHGDTKSWKLVTCLKGSLYFVLVDNRPTSDTYIMWESLILDDKTRKQFHYKWSYEGDYPDVQDQFTIKWNDPMIGVHWPIDNPILSKRDK